MSQKCSICGDGHAWKIDNAYLAEGPKVAKAIANELGISQPAYYRHIRLHLPMKMDSPPENPESLNWTRATINLAKAAEVYPILSKPEEVENLAIITESDEKGPFVALFVVAPENAINEAALNRMASDLGLDIQSKIVGHPAIKIRRQILAKLYAPSITMGRRS